MSQDFTVRELSGYTLVHVMTRGELLAAADLLKQRLAMDIPLAANTATSGAHGLKVLWFGPGRWLIHAPSHQWHLDDVPGCAVTDLSDSRRIFTISGERASERLATACPLDLEDSSTPPGFCALTQFDSFSVLLYRNDRSSYDLYVDRSYSEDMLQALGCGLDQLQ